MMKQYSLWAIDESALQKTIETLAQRDETLPNTNRWVAEIFGNVITSDGLAILNINGSLVDYVSYWYASYKDIIKALELAEADERVQAIVLDINSPGGMVSGLFEAAHAISSCSKPVYAYAEGQCCSAAYLLASSTKRFITTPSTDIGSIGACAVVTDYTKAMQKAGIERVMFTSKYASKKNLDPLSDEGKKEIQKALDEHELLLIETIAKNRGVTAEDVRTQFGQGLIFRAEEAKNYGMVDDVVANFEACIDTIMPSQIEGGGEPMTLEELKKNHPEFAAQLAEEGRVMGMAEGEQKERERILALDALASVPHGSEIVATAKVAGTSLEEVRAQILQAQVEKGVSVQQPSGIAMLEAAVVETAEGAVNPLIAASGIPNAESEAEAAATRAAAAIAAKGKK